MKNGPALFILLMLALTVILLLPILLPIGSSHGSTPPDEVVSEFWNLHQQGKREEAKVLLTEEAKKEEIKMLNEGTSSEITINIENKPEKIGDFEEILLENLELETVAYEKIENRKRFALLGIRTSVVDVTLTKPDFEDTFDRFLSEGMEELTLMHNNDSSREEIKEKAEEIIMNLLKEAKKVTHKEQVNLRLVDIRSAGDMGGWLIKKWEFDTINNRINEINEKINGKLII